MVHCSALSTLSFSVLTWTGEKGGLRGLCTWTKDILVTCDWTRICLHKSLSSESTSLVAQTVKCLPTMQETWVQSLGWEDPLEKEMATDSSTLAWKIPWMEEPGRLQSMGSQSRTRLSDFTLSSQIFWISLKNIAVGLSYLIFSLILFYNGLISFHCRPILVGKFYHLEYFCSFSVISVGFSAKSL